MTGDIISEGESGESIMGVYGYSNIKDLAAVISKKDFDFIWRFVFFIGTRLSEIALMNYNSETEKFSHEFVNDSLALVDVSRNMQKNIPLIKKYKISDELLATTNGYLDVEELTAVVSKMSLSSIGKIMFFIGNYLNIITLEQYSKKDKEVDLKLLKIGVSLKEIGRKFIFFDKELTKSKISGTFSIPI